MRERGLDPKGRSAWSDLSKAIGGDFDRIQIGKWMRGDTETIPAAFIEALDRHGFASAQWLVSGSEDIGEPESETRMAVVRQATTAEVEDLKRMLDAATPPPASQEEEAKASGDDVESIPPEDGGGGRQDGKEKDGTDDE